MFVAMGMWYISAHAREVVCASCVRVSKLAIVRLRSYVLGYAAVRVLGGGAHVWRLLLSMMRPEARSVTCGALGVRGARWCVRLSVWLWPALWSHRVATQRVGVDVVRWCVWLGPALVLWL